MKLFPSFLIDLWKDIVDRRPKLSVMSIASTSDLPESLTPDTLFIVGNAKKPKWVMMRCPCGCGERIDVSLMPTRKPTWTMTRRRAGVTLTPSLWRPRGTCGSHFWIVNSRVEWVGLGKSMPTLTD